MPPTPLTTTRRLLLSALVLLVPLDVAPKDLAPPSSVSCLDSDGEKYLQGLLDRIHQLEAQLDLETEARLTERAEAERKIQSVTNELTHQAVAALDPPRPPSKVEGFDPDQAKKELAALKAALEDANKARRNAEAEAAAASKTAVTFANALKEVERRLDVEETRNTSASVAREEGAEVREAKVAAPVPVAEPSVKLEATAPTELPTRNSESQQAATALSEKDAASPVAYDAPSAALPVPAPSPNVEAAEPLPATTAVSVSERDLAAAQLAALSGRRAAPAIHDTSPPAAPAPEPIPSDQVVGPIPTATPAATSESERAAAQLAALSGKSAAPPAHGPLPTVEISAAKPATEVPEKDRAAAQLAALTGKKASPSANPALLPAAPKAAEVATPPSPGSLGSIEAQPRRTRCDEPPETARIAPGDRLAIHVDHLKEVSDTVEVGSDGRVHLALVGTVPAAGRNQREFAADLTQRLTAYLQAPRVDVALKRDCGR